MEGHCGRMMGGKTGGGGGGGGGIGGGCVQEREVKTHATKSH